MALGLSGNQLQLQAQQMNNVLSQVLTLLLSLMQSGGAAAQPNTSGGGSDAIASVSGAGGGASAKGAEKADEHGGETKKGDGSTVQRQGKPIGAHIAEQFDDMVAAAKKDGVNITITSGARSREEQEKLYAAYKNGTGNLAAKPGTSNHESGDALDLGPPSAYSWLKQNAGQFGFKNGIPSEPWHWSLTGK